MNRQNLTISLSPTELQLIFYYYLCNNKCVTRIFELLLLVTTLTSNWIEARKGKQVKQFSASGDTEVSNEGKMQKSLIFLSKKNNCSSAFGVLDNRTLEGLLKSNANFSNFNRVEKN